MSSKSDSKDWPLPKPSFAEEYSILYQIARYEAHDRETAWYGVYNLALISLIERSKRNTGQNQHQSERSQRHSERSQRGSEQPKKQPPPSKDVILALVSQPPLTEVRSENTIVSDDDSISTNQQLRSSRRQDSAVFQGLDTTISGWGSEEDSARLTGATNSIARAGGSGSDGQCESTILREIHKYPDIAVLYGHAIEALPEETGFTEESLGVRFAPCQRVLLVLEIKRLPQAYKDKKDFLSEIERMLEVEMKPQVFKQVRATFLHYQKQKRVTHLSGVGDYFRVRVFHRKDFEKRGYLEPLQDGFTYPPWGEITISRSVKVQRLLKPGEKDVNSSLKTAWTLAKNELIKEMDEELKPARLQLETEGLNLAEGTPTS